MAWLLADFAISVGNVLSLPAGFTKLHLITTKAQVIENNRVLTL